MTQITNRPLSTCAGNSHQYTCDPAVSAQVDTLQKTETCCLVHFDTIKVTFFSSFGLGTLTNAIMEWRRLSLNTISVITRDGGKMSMSKPSGMSFAKKVGAMLPVSLSISIGLSVVNSLTEYLRPSFNSLFCTETPHVMSQPIKDLENSIEQCEAGWQECVDALGACEKKVQA